MIPLAALCLAGWRQTGNGVVRTNGRPYHAELQSRTPSKPCVALDEVMTKIPLDQATPGIKAHMAEFILKTAAEGQTSYDALLSAASDNIQTISRC